MRVLVRVCKEQGIQGKTGGHVGWTGLEESGRGMGWGISVCFVGGVDAEIAPQGWEWNDGVPYDCVG